MPENRLERMDEFFENRIVGYDEHMLCEVDGCAAGYRKMAEVLADRMGDGRRLLDLGCGTGLELDEIWKLLPSMRVVGIDMTQAMLDELKRKHPDKEMALILGDYRTADFGGGFDAAVSFQTMHHFPIEEKLPIYEKIYQSLKEGSAYIECDYMCDTDEQEQYFLDEYARLKREQGIGDGYYHYDLPCTVAHQLEVLVKAGFKNPAPVFREGNTVMLVAIK